MSDIYPRDTSIPQDYLVPPELQPTYLEIPGVALGDAANVGIELSDRHVWNGNGERAAIVHHESGQTLTFADLRRESNRLANGLVELGLRPGDRVAFRSPNRPETVVTALATWKAGGVVVPTPAQAKGEELRYFLDDTEARFLVTVAADVDPSSVATAVDGGTVEHVIAFGDGEPGTPYTGWSQLVAAASSELATPHRSSDHVALVWHTGGTTGRPKACYHTHRRFLLAGHATGRATGVLPGQVWAAAAPIGHALGFIHNTNFTLLHGATTVHVEGFGDPEVVVHAIERHRIDTFTTMAAGWSAIATVLEDRPSADVSCLQRAFAMWQASGASATRDYWHARGLELRNNFGSTAFAGWVLVPRADEAYEPASLGRASPGYVVTAVEDDLTRGVREVLNGTIGRLAVRGPSGLTYWRRHELQQRDVLDGWTVVDDLIRYQPSGNAAYLGRTDFLISSAGYKVAPAEVETALGTHPSVREVCVVGAPDMERQEVIAAFVVLAPGYRSSPALVHELQDHVKDRISPYKYPRRIEFVPALPRDHVGKLQPRIVREWATKGLPHD